jgi:peptidyl-prolyl cis-trans isomerase C
MQLSQTPTETDSRGRTVPPEIMTPASPISSAPMAGWKRWLREPLLQFLLVGAVLFAAYRALHPEVERAEQTKRIVLTADDLIQMSVASLAQGRPAPTPVQMESLVQAKIREEILYREALALGLDKDDTIVKRRLAQKMEFLAEDISMLAEPSTQDLRAWFERNTARFALPPRVSFRHLYFSSDRRGEHAKEAAMKALGMLAGKPSDASDAAALADPFMFQDVYVDRSFDQVATLFGPNFARELLPLTPGSWQGPIESGYGWHLIHVESSEPSRIPSFEEIEPDIKAEWVVDERAQAKRRAYEAMRARYEVVLPAAPEK